jgi:hypothetical protein
VIGADRGVPVRAGDLPQSVDVAEEDLQRLAERRGPPVPQAVGGLVFGQD